MRLTSRSLAIVSALASGAAAVACVPSASLVPLAPHDDDGVATVEQSGIVLTAEVKPGLHHVPPSITPIHISIENGAKGGIHVEPDQIELVGDAAALVTLPAAEIRPRRPVGLSIDPSSPYASAQGASALQYSASPRDLGTFNLDPALPFTSSGGWRSPASREILASAFEGGFIDVGERMSGLIYFRTPPEGAGLLTLRVRVHGGSASAPVEALEIPYAVGG